MIEAILAKMPSTINRREQTLQKGFYYAIAIIILASNTDLVRAATHYYANSSNIDEVFAIIRASSFVDRLYMLVGNAFNYASVIFCWIVFNKKAPILKFYSLWAGLIASALYFFISTWDLWLPIAQGASMSESFGLGFVKITLYTNVVGLLSCMLGLAYAKRALIAHQ